MNHTHPKGAVYCFPQLDIIRQAMKMVGVLEAEPLLARRCSDFAQVLQALTGCSLLNYNLLKPSADGNNFAQELFTILAP